MKSYAHTLSFSGFCLAPISGTEGLPGPATIKAFTVVKGEHPIIEYWPLQKIVGLSSFTFGKLFDIGPPNNENLE